MSLRLGVNNIAKAYLGSTEIIKGYLGNILVFDSGAFEAEYQAVLDRAIIEGFGLPSAAEQIKGNDLVKELKANGSFQKMTTLQVYSGSNSDFARIDWIDPTNVYVSVNSPSYTSGNGFKFDGATNYLKSNNFKMTTDLQTLQKYGGGWNASDYAYDGQFRAFMGIQESTAQTYNQYVREGSGLGTTAQLGNPLNIQTANYLQDSINYSVTSVGGVTKLYEDGVPGGQQNVAITNTALLTPREWHVGSVNLNNSPNFYSLCSMKYFFLGVSLEGLEASTNTAFENYLA